MNITRKVVTYKIEGEPLSFLQIREQLATRFPETAPRISDEVLRSRLQRTMRWDRLGQCPVESIRNARKMMRTRNSTLLRKKTP